MTEVLGLVASGLSVAHVTGSIVTNSLKVKALLDEVKDAPDTLKDMLDQLELLTPMLSEETADNGDATGAVSIRSSRLQRARAACQEVSEKLEVLAMDLKSEIDLARSGTRRTHARIKVVLKKSALAQHERRLQQAIQLLNIAQNNYVISLQRAQHHEIMNYIKLAFARSTSGVRANVEIPSLETSSQSQTKPLGRFRSDNHGSRRIFFQLGFSNVTGFIRDLTTYNENTLTHRRIQIHMPTWLSTSMFEVEISRNGWEFSTMRCRNLPEDSEECHIVSRALVNDDVDLLRRVFREKSCGPRDRLVFTSGWLSSNFSVIQGALILGAWRSMAYLLFLGAKCENFRYGVSNTTSVQELPDLEALLRLGVDSTSDPLLIKCLATCPDDRDLFFSLIGRVWPPGPNSFYDAASSEQRLDLAMTLVQSFGYMQTRPSPAIFCHLCETLSLEEANATSTTGISMCLARGLGQLVWQDSCVGDCWHRAISDAVLRLNRCFLMPERQLCEQFSITDLQFSMGFDGSMPFTELLVDSMGGPLPGGNDDPGRARQHKITSRLLKCERALHLWLEILQHRGIDLLEYGKQTRRVLDQRDYSFRLFRDVWFDDKEAMTENGVFSVRLISLTCGHQLDNWKLWWSEPTDELVGDFWREMEPEPLYIPGSWVED